MASRGSKKNSVKPDKKVALAADMREKWRKSGMKFAVVAAVLLALTLIFSLPFSWNGTLSVKADGEFTMDASGPLYDLIMSGEESSALTEDISLSLPANPWMVIFAPTYCNGGDTFLLTEALTGMGLDYDRQAAGYMDNPFDLTQKQEGMLDSASIALYVISILVILAMAAMTAVCITAIAGKLSAKAAFIAALVFTALAVVQFIFGIVVCSTRIPDMGEADVTVVPGAFMIISVVAGAAISAVTGVWSKKCDKARAEYLELQAEIDKK